MEVAAVFLFIFLPGLVIGGFIGFKISKGLGVFGRIFWSIICGLFFAYVVMPIAVSTFNSFRGQHKKEQLEKQIERQQDKLPGHSLNMRYKRRGLT